MKSKYELLFYLFIIGSFISCENMDPQNCENFNSGDPFYECVLDEINDRCKLTIRKCEELPFEKCSDYIKNIYYSIVKIAL